MNCKKSRNHIGGIVGILAIIVMMLGASSCRSTKKLQAAIAKKDTTVIQLTHQMNNDSIQMIRKTMDGIKSKKLDFQTFSAKIKVEYEDSKGKQPNITAYVKMAKDSFIWISGFATVFNIEAFRLFINKDSVVVIDRINKEVQIRTMDYLQDVTDIPFDLKTLQDLLIGNPIFFNDSVVTYKEGSPKILLATIGQYFKHLLTINKENQLILHSKLDDLDINRNRTADITYNDYENTTGVNFSTYREITVSEKNKLEVRLNFKQYEFNKELQVNFNIPKNYKRK